MDSYLVVESGPRVSIYTAKAYGQFKTYRQAHEFAVRYPKPAQVIVRDDAIEKRRWPTLEEKCQLIRELIYEND